MFFNRLKWFTIAMAVLALVILIRLVDIQVVRADQFEALADRMLTRPIVYLAAPRGSILDREGRVLVSDEPTSDVCVHYALLLALTDRPEGIAHRDEHDLPPATRRYLRAVARELRKLGEVPPGRSTSQIVDELIGRVDASWDRLCELTGVSRDELVARARRVCHKVDAIRRWVRQRSPTVRDIAEEHTLHPLIEDIDPDTSLRIRLELEPLRWISVVPASRRVQHETRPLVHLLGRMGAASPARIESDPHAGDPLRGLRAGDRCGVSGIERLAELTLRGVRGRIVRDFDRRKPPVEHLAPQSGHDVRLTIDAELQRFVYDVLGEAVKGSEFPCGGSAVVLDAHTREVLALVSYPSYSDDEYRRDYAHLRGDARWMPLRFRAVANAYPPGSTCKVITLYGALADGKVTPQSTITCNGIFRPSLPNAFRCWIYNQYRATHGPQDAIHAVRNSCNIYFYTLGDRLGSERLCEWFARFGLGGLQGTGLIEETRGIVPDAEWIARHRPDRPRLTPADAWNFAIGQGEVSATPLQSANVVATVATDRWEPVRLMLDSAGAPITLDGAPPARDFDDKLLRTVRHGMWLVVNDRGTAKLAKLDSPDYEICGKTGSAQAIPRRISNKWTLEFADGHREEVIEPLDVDRQTLLQRYPEPQPKIVGRHTYERFPPLGVDGKLPSHAWFIGYTQRKDTPRGARPRGRVYAISVLVEFGGSGGHVAAPCAKRIAEHLLSRPQEWGRSDRPAPVALQSRPARIALRNRPAPAAVGR